MSTQQSSNSSSAAPVQRAASSSSSRSAPSRSTAPVATRGAAAARASGTTTTKAPATNRSSASTPSTSRNTNSDWNGEARQTHTQALSSAFGDQPEKDERNGSANAAAHQKTEVNFRTRTGGEDPAGVGEIRDKQKAEETRPTEQPKPVEDSKKTEEARKNDPFVESRDKLNEAFKASKILDEQSQARMGKMMTEFESRMASLAAMKIEAYQRTNGTCPPEMAAKFVAEAKQKVNDTYKNLSEMVGTPQGQGELFSQADRASLAEGLMFHLADPRTMDQGSNGTCWINSSTASYGLMTQPDDIARFMKEISLTGTFNALNNGTPGQGGGPIRFNKGMFYATGQERNWKISNAIGGSARSPVGMFLDEAMTEMVGKHRADAGDYNGQWGAKRIMTMITGEAPPAPRGRLGNARTNRNMTQEDLNVMLQYGGFQIYSPGHLQSISFVPEGHYGWQGDNLTFNGNSIALDGSHPMAGYIVLDNQWGEGNDFVTHAVNGNGQITDIRDQRYQHFDPGKVNNERSVTIQQGNDSNGGGGGGGGIFDGGGGGGEGGGGGGLLGLIQSILQAVLGGGGGGAAGGAPNLTSPEGWMELLGQLLGMAEGEVEGGAPGSGFEMLEQAYPQLVGSYRPDHGLMERIQTVLASGAQRKADAAFPDLVDMLG